MAHHQPACLPWPGAHTSPTSIKPVPPAKCETRRCCLHRARRSPHRDRGLAILLPARGLPCPSPGEPCRGVSFLGQSAWKGTKPSIERRPRLVGPAASFHPRPRVHVRVRALAVVGVRCIRPTPGEQGEGGFSRRDLSTKNSTQPKPRCRWELVSERGASAVISVEVSSPRPQVGDTSPARARPPPRLVPSRCGSGVARQRGRGGRGRLGRPSRTPCPL